MRVVHITNTLEGGAGKAVWRIHERLQERGLQSLVITKQESSPKPVNKLKSLFNQKKNSLLWRWNRLLSKEPLSYTKQNELTYKYSFFSKAENLKISYDYILDAIRDGDLVIFYWLGLDTLNSAAIKDIYQKKKVRMYWFAVDMAPITGGCHYFWDCTGYISGCSNCPVISSGDDFSPKKQLKKKIENLSKVSIGLLASSDMGLTIFKQAKIKYNSYTKIPYPINTDIFNFTSDIENANEFSVFFNAQNINDVRKGWVYFKEYVLQLDSLLANVPNRFIVNLITVHNEIHLAELPHLKNIQFVNYGWADSEESLAKLYKKANLFICTSVEDLSPLMVNEALLCGVPVFGFDNASNKEYIVENLNGSIFAFEDTKGMAEKTINYLTDRTIFKDKLTIRNSVLPLHEKESWFNNYFKKLLNEK